MAPPPRRESASAASSATSGGLAISAPNRGGAVLWYLRKHAPMPTDPAAAIGLKSSFCATKAEGSLSGRQDARSKPVSRHPQRQFLHDALLAIGAELDEEAPGNRPESRTATGSRPVSRAEHGSASARREQLRKGFAAHTDAERGKLEALVAEREAEVKALQLQAEQLESLVATTRLAAARRSVRLNNKSDAGAGLENGLRSTVSSLVRAKKNFMKSAGISVFDHEVGAVGGHEKPEALESWKRSVANQSEQVNMVRVRIEERANSLQKQTQQRKAVEAQLFGSHAECLSFGHKATRMEERATRLAKELRRVYKDLPRIVERNLTASAETTRRKVCGEELQKVRDKNVEHAFKFLSTEQLLDETSACDQYIWEMTEFTQSAASIITEGRNNASTMQQHAKFARDSLDALRDAVTKEVQMLVRVQQANDAAGVAPLARTAAQAKHEAQLASTVDESQVVLEQLGLELVAIEELLSIESTNEYDQELQNLLRRCSGYASKHSSTGGATSAVTSGQRGLESPELVDDSVLASVGGSQRPSYCPASQRPSLCPSPLLEG